MNKPVRLVAESAPDSAFTARDYAEMLNAGAFAGLRVELVKGELRKMMSSGLSRGEMNFKLAVLLQTAYAGTDRRFAIDLAIGIDQLTIRGADIAVVLPDAPPRGAVPAENLVLIVVISQTTLGEDLGAKLADSARAGVPEYWLVDLNDERIEQYREPSAAGYRAMHLFLRGETLSPVFAPDLTVQVDDVLGPPATPATD